MSVGSLWLVNGFTFLFISGICVQATTLHCLPEKVFENETVAIVLSLDQPSEYASFWNIDQTPVAFVSWKNGQCTKYILKNITSMSVLCNSTSVSIKIEKVQNSLHGKMWSVDRDNTPDALHTSIFVKVPVSYVSVTLQSGEFRRKLTYVENETATLECTSSLSRPQPTNIWFIGQSYGDASIVASNSFNESDGTYNYTRSVLAFTANSSNNNKWIFCNSSNVPEFAPVFSNYSVLDVQYPPSIEQLEDSSIIEGKLFTKTCPIQEGNPAETQITWTSMKSIDIILANVTLGIVNISRNHATQYTCFARNMMTRSNGSLQEGMARSSFYLNVLSSPQSLINTLSLNNTMHFGLRGRQEHTSMLWGDVELNTTATGTEYLSFTERATKTRKGLTTDSRQFTPKMFSQPETYLWQQNPRNKICIMSLEPRTCLILYESY